MAKKPKVALISDPVECGSDSTVTLYLEGLLLRLIGPAADTVTALMGPVPHHEFGGNVESIRVFIRPGKARSMLDRARRYLWAQMLMLKRLPGVCRGRKVVAFFSLAELYFPLMLAAKVFLRKKICVIHCGCSSNNIRVEGGRLAKAMSFLVKIMERVSFAAADAILVESPGIVESHNLQRYRKKIHICPSYYIDEELYRPGEEVDRRANAVGYIGRFGADKGAMNFARGICLIDGRLNSEFLIVGGFGPEVGEVADVLKQSGCMQKVSLVGHVAPSEVVAYLGRLKLLVLPSFGEGLPKTILEAMACGTPVLATAVGGIADVIKDGETGFILESTSPECIAQGIVKALQRPDLAAVAERARKLVLDEYTLGATQGKWSQALGRISGMR